MDATSHDGFHQRTHVFIDHRALQLVIPAVIMAVAHGLILQVALAALVTDWAIKGMVNEQKFHHPFARLGHRFGIGSDDHAVTGGHGTGGNWLRCPLHFDQAHPAVAGDRQPVVVTKARDFDAGFLTGLQDRRSCVDFDFYPVDCQLRHCSLSVPPVIRPPLVLLPCG